MSSLTRRMQRALRRSNPRSLQRGAFGRFLGVKNPNGGVFLKKEKK